MKKTTKFICLLLAVMMVVALLPTMAMAEETDTTAAAANSNLTANGSLSGLLEDFLNRFGGLVPGGGSGSGESGSGSGAAGELVQVINGVEVPDYLIYCSLMGKAPASGAKVTIKNLASVITEGEVKSAEYTANMLGLVMIPKKIIGTYTATATANGVLTGLKYKSIIPSMSLGATHPDVDKIVLFPDLAIELNYTDHTAYLKGYPEGIVGPMRNITRAEVATILYRLMTDASRNKYSSNRSTFSDVNAADWYGPAICTLVNAGVISGYPDGTFKPQNNVTRAEFSAMVARLFKVSYSGANVFGDIGGSWYTQYMNILGKLGILKGDGNHNANPNDLLTRAEAATMCNRLLGRFPTSASFANVKGLKQWPDNPTTAWYYADIVEASNSHNYTYNFDYTRIPAAAMTQDFSGIITEKWTSLK